MVTQITTHLPDALSRLLSAYQSRPRIVGLLTALLQEIQPLENGIFPLVQGRMLAYAVGAQLDALGTVIGLPRNGATDTVYRALLGGTIGENNSDGTQTVLLTLIAALYIASAVFISSPNSPGQTQSPTPAAITVEVGSPQLPPAIYPLALQILQNALGAGVGLLSLSSFNASGAFAMAGPQSWVGGFGDVNNLATGGQFASLLYSNPAL